MGKKGKVNKARGKTAKAAAPVVRCLRDQPFTEKYRPKDLASVQGQTHVTNALT